jgi:hypothetical protein
MFPRVPELQQKILEVYQNPSTLVPVLSLWSSWDKLANGNIGILIETVWGQMFHFCPAYAPLFPDPGSTPSNGDIGTPTRQYGGSTNRSSTVEPLYY